VARHHTKNVYPAHRLFFILDPNPEEPVVMEIAPRQKQSPKDVLVEADAPLQSLSAEWSQPLRIRKTLLVRVFSGNRSNGFHGWGTHLGEPPAECHPPLGWSGDKVESYGKGCIALRRRRPRT
jgi:hypothetical protein